MLYKYGVYGNGNGKDNREKEAKKGKRKSVPPVVLEEMEKEEGQGEGEGDRGGVERCCYYDGGHWRCGCCGGCCCCCCWCLEEERAPEEAVKDEAAPVDAPETPAPVTVDETPIPVAVDETLVLIDETPAPVEKTSTPVVTDHASEDQESGVIRMLNYTVPHEQMSNGVLDLMQLMEDDEADLPSFRAVLSSDDKSEQYFDWETRKGALDYAAEGTCECIAYVYQG